MPSFLPLNKFLLMQLDIQLFKCFSIIKKRQMYLPLQHSVQNLRSISGIKLHLRSGDSSPSFVNRNAFSTISAISSPESHITLLRVACLICTNWSGLNTPGFSYQNLEYFSQIKKKSNQNKFLENEKGFNKLPGIA